MPKKKKRKLPRLNPFYVPQAVDRIALLCAQVFGKVKKIEGILLTEDPGPYVYFVSYRWSTIGNHGSGDAAVDMQRPIKNMDGINLLRAHITDLNPSVSGVVIINFIRLEN